MSYINPWAYGAVDKYVQHFKAQYGFQSNANEMWRSKWLRSINKNKHGWFETMVWSGWLDLKHGSLKHGLRSINKCLRSNNAARNLGPSSPSQKPYQQAVAWAPGVQHVRHRATGKSSATWLGPLWCLGLLEKIMLCSWKDLISLPKVHVVLKWNQKVPIIMLVTRLWTKSSH